MCTTIKTVELGQDNKVVITYSAEWDSGINADGHFVETSRKLVTRLTVKLGNNSGLNALNKNNKFDAEIIAKGAVATIGRQPIGQATYDKVIAAIDAAKSEALDSEMIKYITAIDAARAENEQAETKYNERVSKVYKMMER